MSDHIMPRLVSADALPAIFGSKDHSWLERLSTEAPGRVASLNQWFEEYYEGRRDNEDDFDPATRLDFSAALTDILNGHLTTDHYEVYLSTWELLCDSLGERLDEHWAYRSEWVEPFDELLKSHGLRLQILELAYSSQPPFPLPRNPDLGMSVGYWPAADLDHARAVLARNPLHSDDPEFQDTIDSIVRWLELAARVPSGMIVGFCY